MCFGSQLTSNKNCAQILVLLCTVSTTVIAQQDQATILHLESVAPGANDKHQLWDWVPAKSLPEDCEIKPGCDGAYLAPARDDEEADLIPKDAPVRISADRSATTDKIVRVSGNVEIIQGYRKVNAGKVVYDRDRESMVLEQNFQIREPGLLMRGSEATIDSTTGLGRYRDTQILNHESGIRIIGGNIERLTEDVVLMEEVVYTQCTPDDEVWHIEADTMRLDYESGFGTARNMSLNIKDVPVLYSPWFMFPVDDRRMTGLLFPTIGYSSDIGFDYTQPIYFNLAPNYDATYTPRWMEKRGLMHQLEFRYLSDTLGSWQVFGSHLKDDKFAPEDPELRQAENNEEDAVLTRYEEGMDRWSTRLSHSSRFATNWSTFIDYTKVSDIDYFDDFDEIGLGLQRRNHLKQTARLRYLDSNWRSTLSVTEYQTIYETDRFPYQILPKLEIENLSSNGNFALDWLFEGQYAQFDNVRSEEDGFNRTTGNRLFLETGISYPMNWAPGYIIPTVKARHLNYRLDEPQSGTDSFEKELEATSLLATADMGLVFERPVSFNEQAYTQTMEPRLYYFVSENQQQDDFPDFDTRELDFSYSQLFRDSRFSGYDRLDDAKQISLALTSRFTDKNSGSEIFTISAGQIFYFDNREVSLNAPTEEDLQNSSSFATEIQYQPSSSFWITHGSVWDHKDNTIDDASVNLHYRSGNDALFNLTYRFERDGSELSGSNEKIDLEQYDFSAVLPINEQWTFFTRYRYNATLNSRLEDTSGFEYESCCWRVRALYQREVEDEFLNENGKISSDQDYKFMLEFELKGLGGLGGKAKNLLEKSILGYEEISE